ncbi:hypothetical protein PFISCL1PPCAC_3180, partial [Pristionchus fissidentatus]
FLFQRSATTRMDALLARIVQGGDRVFYRHEQQGDAELTAEGKREILTRLFAESPPVFLQRYSRWIHKSDAPLFARFENPLVAYFLDKLDRPPPTEAQRRNRRYNALEKLKKEGMYFSDAKMEERAPALYLRMVGRYLGEDEQLHLRPTIMATEANGWAGLLTRLEDRVDEAVQHRRAADADEAAGDWIGGGEGKRDASDRLLAHVDGRFKMEEEDEEEEEE